MTVKCPYCGEPVEVESKRLDGGRQVREHARHCQFWPTRVARGCFTGVEVAEPS